MDQLRKDNDELREKLSEEFGNSMKMLETTKDSYMEEVIKMREEISKVRLDRM